PAKKRRLKPAATSEIASGSPRPPRTTLFPPEPRLMRLACIVCAILAAALALGMFVAPTTARAQDKPVSFINDVAPILKESCFACHDAKKRSGKFDMTTFEKFLAGGNNDSPV